MGNVLHPIVRGPRPDRRTALSLAGEWSLIRIGTVTPPALAAWHISTREFREDLQWAVIVSGDGEFVSPVAQLLNELPARGIPIRDRR